MLYFIDTRIAFTEIRTMEYIAPDGTVEITKFDFPQAVGKI